MIESMDIFCNGRIFRFEQVKLVFENKEIQNLFAFKNNKTVIETIDDKRYKSLKSNVERKYISFLQRKLGEFLYSLKIDGDDFYKKFLNNYGDEKYRKFRIYERLASKGLYCYTLHNQIMYIGRCHDTFQRRINNGYGNISPKNCYLDGQSTNCHLNSLIAANYNEIELFVCPLENNREIDEIEELLIRKHKPSWNIALKY